MEASLSSASLRELAKERVTFVAVEGTAIVGTASIGGDQVHAVFVHPARQGRGIGRHLWRTVREHFDGDARLVVMAKSLFRIRRAQPTDAGRIHELHTTSVRTLCRGHYAADVIDGWLLNRRPEGYLPPIERGDLFVVHDDTEIVGFGEAAPGVVIAVYVDPSAVRRGVGSLIMGRALEIARRGHEGGIRLESTLNARPFYERFGFREIERSTVRRGPVAIPVIVMERRDA